MSNCPQWQQYKSTTNFHTAHRFSASCVMHLVPLQAFTKFKGTNLLLLRFGLQKSTSSTAVVLLNYECNRIKNIKWSWSTSESWQSNHLGYPRRFQGLHCVAVKTRRFMKHEVEGIWKERLWCLSGETE